MDLHTAERASGSRLAIELGTPVQLDSPRIEGRFRASLVGLLTGVCVILTHPTVRYEIGDSIAVRYFHQGAVYGFRTDVRTVVNNPVKLLIVGYPVAVQEQNLRQSPRLDCTLPCRVTIGSMVPRAGLLRDISRDGCQVALLRDAAAPVSLEAGERVELSFGIPPEERVFEASGNVRRLVDDGRNVQIGVAFDVPAEEAYDAVRTLLDPIAQAQRSG